MNCKLSLSTPKNEISAMKDNRCFPLRPCANTRRRIITQLLAFMTMIWLISCTNRSALDDILRDGEADQKDVIGEIIMHQTGGFAGVSQMITIGEKDSSILLVSVDKSANQRSEQPVAVQDLAKLWQTLEVNDVFTLPTNQELLANLADGFNYEITVRRDEKQNRFSVYAPDQLIDRGEKRYSAITRAIRQFVDSHFQGRASGIEGVVTDFEGVSVRGMGVWIVGGTTAFPKIAVETNKDGYYRIRSVLPGTFEVGVHDEGGNRVELKRVTVKGDQTTTLNFIIPAQTDKRFIIGDMPIDDISVEILESFPLQIHLVVKGFLRDGCTKLNKITQQRAEDVIRVNITTKRPKDEICIQVIQEVTERIPLKGRFLPGHYKVIVNGVEKEFEISGPESSILQGKVTIGPLCPVEPCNIPPEQVAEIYQARKVIIYEQSTKEKVAETPLFPSGEYFIILKPGRYIIDISDAQGDALSLDLSKRPRLGNVIPREIELRAGDEVVVDFRIDTGIR